MNYATAEKVFGEVNGGTFVGLDTLTDITLVGGKSNAMQGRVTKLVTGSNVQVFGNNKSNAYSNMVKRRLEKEGKDPADFTLSPRAWGQRIPGTCFVEHKGKHYVEVIFIKAGEVQYLLDGKPIAKEDVVGLKETARKGQSGLEDAVIINTYALDSIVEARANGMSWR